MPHFQPKATSTKRIRRNGKEEPIVIYSMKIKYIESGLTYFDHFKRHIALFVSLSGLDTVAYTVYMVLVWFACAGAKWGEKKKTRN